MGNRIIATDKDNDERVGILLLTTEQGFNLQNETKTLAQTFAMQVLRTENQGDFI